MRSIIIYLFFILLMIPHKALAASDIPADSTVHAWFPFLSFDSDIGVVGGGLWNRYYYLEEVSPFGNITEGRAHVSSKGRFLGRFAHERVNFLDGPLRIRGEVLVEQLLTDNYFGAGNVTKLNDAKWDEGWYHYRSWTGEMTLRLRYPLLDRLDDVQLDLLILGGSLFYRAYETDGQLSLLFEDLDSVNEQPLATYVGTGILWDNRDNEFDTRYGTYAEIEWSGFPGFLSAGEKNGSVSQLNTDFRAFYSLRWLDDLTVAGRFGTEWVAGDPPFWMLPVLGGEETLRGYHLRRFRDRTVIYNSLTLRKWLLALPVLNMRLGLQAFTDSGRVFGGDDSFSDLSRSYHRAFGSGLLISAFTDDFIIRTDYALSEETGRLYISIGFVY